MNPTLTKTPTGRMTVIANTKMCKETKFDLEAIAFDLGVSESEAIRRMISYVTRERVSLPPAPSELAPGERPGEDAGDSARLLQRMRSAVRPVRAGVPFEHPLTLVALRFFLDDAGVKHAQDVTTLTHRLGAPHSPDWMVPPYRRVAADVMANLIMRGLIAHDGHGGSWCRITPAGEALLSAAGGV